jgi:hypothetical protein
MDRLRGRGVSTKVRWGNWTCACVGQRSSVRSHHREGGPEGGSALVAHEVSIQTQVPQAREHSAAQAFRNKRGPFVAHSWQGRARVRQHRGRTPHDSGITIDKFLGDSPHS